MRWTKVGLLLSFLLLTLHHAYPAQIMVTQGEILDMPVNVLAVHGEILQGDFRKFINALQSMPRNQAALITLKGPGGTLIDSVSIGTVIRKNNLKTLVVGECYSGCAFISVAGYKKGLWGANAVLGFHGVYLPNTGEISAPGNAHIESYLTKLGYNIDFIRMILYGQKEFVLVSQADVDLVATVFKVHFYPINDEQQLLDFVMMQ
jgi:hypothetical protein